jgi:hypothetical protein
VSQPFENRAGWDSPQFGLPAGNPYGAAGNPTGTAGNPYGAPQNVFADNVGVKPGGPFPHQPRRRPGAVTAICIIAIILGAMGALTALSSIANGLMGGQMQTMFTPPAQPGVPKEMQKAQEEMQAALAAVANRYAIINAAIGVLHVGLVVALIWGGVRTLGLSNKARKALQITMLVAIVFEIGRAIPASALQLEMLPILENSMEQMMKNAVPAGKQLSPSEEATLKIMPRIMTAAVWAGLAFNLVWVLAKIIFYGVSTRVLGRPNVKAVYEASDPIVASTSGPMSGPPMSGPPMSGHTPGAPA